MSRYLEMFESLKARGEGAFVPFTMLGDPSPESSVELLKTFEAAGADALELGLPFSDPVADGPTIQAAATRTLAAGIGSTEALGVIRAYREQGGRLPIGLLVYANLVVNRGRGEFYRAMRELEVDSVLVADVPTREAGPFAAAARAVGVAPVLIAAPNSTPKQLARIAELSEGYTYVVSRAGVTGAEAQASFEHQALLAELARLGAPPPLLGFGISSPEQVRAAIASGAAGAICGSAIVAQIPRHRELAALTTSLFEFVTAMKAATRPQG